MARAGIFQAGEIEKTMAKVDRANYVKHPSTAYEDSPQTIGYGATISAPHMHAYAVSHLLPYLRPGSRVLDIGSGSGYLSSVFHHLVGDQGKVVGIEHIQELADWSEENLKKDGLGKALETGSVKIICGDGRQGWADEGPYDAIHVGAAAPVLPEKLVEQLKAPGRIFIPIGTYAQFIHHVDKDQHGKVHRTQVMGVSYVPLTDQEKQREFL